MEPKVYHPANCDGCKKNITGIRWKCVNCMSYDLCGECEANNPDKKHAETHLFMKIVKPVFNYGYHCPLPDLYEPIKKSKPVWEQTKEEHCNPIVCPACMNAGTLSCCALGQCERCGVQIPSMSNHFCSECSRYMEVCHMCEQPIRDGNYYIQKLDKIIGQYTEAVKSYENKDDNFGKSMCQYYQEQLKEMEKVKIAIAGKSRYEIIMLKNHYIEI